MVFQASQRNRPRLCLSCFYASYLSPTKTRKKMKEHTLIWQAFRTLAAIKLQTDVWECCQEETGLSGSRVTCFNQDNCSMTSPCFAKWKDLLLPSFLPFSSSFPLPLLLSRCWGQQTMTDCQQQAGMETSQKPEVAPCKKEWPLGP